ncbi:IPT/TIG domain-containing protein [Nocardia sp. 004]|uniref:IPT/TIG domain-containing protein n=1 Tax=Nocardia sp. 004 TaxID=3385978 RepID=UPI0039A0FABF
MPTITAVFPTSGPPSGGNYVVITGTGFVGPTTVYFGGTATTFTQDNPSQITALAPPGSGTVQVTVVNSGGVSNGVPYTYGAPPPPTLPTLTAIAPTSGPTTGGNLVVLTGTNLTGATAVTFGVNPATSFTVDSDTQITATAPPGAANTIGVTVTTPAGTSAPIAYTYIAPPVAPTLLALNPDVGPSFGNNVVVLIGTGFTGATAVDFGGNPATSFTVDSDSQITATTPFLPAGAFAVTVTTPGGTSNPLPYGSLAPPSVASVVPNSGPTTGGTVVTISGSGYTGATQVRFGTTSAAFVVNSDSSITAVTPPHPAGAVNVIVTRIGNGILGLGFTYV